MTCESCKVVLLEFLQYLDLRSKEGTEPSRDALRASDPFQITLEDVAALSGNDLMAYIYFLSSVLHNSGSTIQKKSCIVRGFIRYMVTNEADFGIHFPEGNPFNAISLEGFSKQEAVTVSVQEIRQILEAAAASPDLGTAMRDYTMILLLATTGIFPEELCSIVYRDVDWEQKQLYIVKSKSPRTVLLTDYLVQALSDLVQYYTEELDFQFYPGSPLFLSTKRKGGIGIRSVQKRLQVATQRANLDCDSISPRLLRSTIMKILGSSFPADADKQFAYYFGLDSPNPYNWNMAQQVEPDFKLLRRILKKSPFWSLGGDLSVPWR